MKFAVLGAGNGGYAMAADMSLAGFEVRLYDVPSFAAALRPVKERGGIELRGSARSGFARIDNVTSDAREALKGADLAMVVVPAFAHRMFAETIASGIEDGQPIVLNPGKVGGALEFAGILRERNPDKEVLVGETQSLIYACRKTGLAQVEIKGVKKELSIAAFPATGTEDLMKVLSNMYPQLVPAKNVLETGLNSPGVVLHPTPTLLNMGWIESRNGEFEHYRKGITRSVANVLEALDIERMSVTKALGLTTVSTKEWLNRFYGAKGESLYDVIQDCSSYAGIGAATDLSHRYVTEDVPYGLVPISSLGHQLNLDTATTDLMIDLASTALERDFRREGRDATRLGFGGLNATQITELLAKSTGLSRNRHPYAGF